MNAPPLPPSLAANPRLDRWLGFEPDGRVRLSTGKVELGQGILTALVQIAAEELAVAPARVRVVAGDTDAAPEEGFTAGSQSIEASGGAIRVAAAEVRALFVAAASLRLNCPPDAIAVADGKFFRDGEPTSLDYWTLAAFVDLAREARGTARLIRPADYRVVGSSFPRIDLPEKIFAAGFIHDLAPPDLIHARVLRRPRPGARLAPPDEAAIRRAADGPVEFVRIGDFFAVLAPDEAMAERAREAALRRTQWTGGTPWRDGLSEPTHLLTLESQDQVLEFPGIQAARPRVAELRARYTRPYLAHGSIAPSVGLARFAGGHLEVLTHSQGVGMLRGALARALGLDPAAISVRHRHGAGCYGHNGADDAAADAAFIAHARPGQWIRVQWTREDELSAAPFGSAMVVDLRAGLDAAGRPVDWTIEVYSGTHGQRPGHNGAVNLLPAEALPDPPPPPKLADVPEAAGFGGMRNARALYDLPPQHAVHHLIACPPLRTSSMRGLGTHGNVFAIESFLDELALNSGEDPLAYRLSLLSDPRGRRVLERVAEMSGWSSRPAGGSGDGWGIAFSRYKNRAAYVAAVAEVFVEEEVQLRRVWCAVDAGLVINPDGAANQIEGGVIQAASWTLKEEVRVSSEGIASAAWETYPVLRFPEIPEVGIAFVGNDQDPTLGLGEAALGPTAAAIGNAVAHALGARVRAMPLTRERIMAALLS
jgi:CO/xanthine dehydrogenase Mo-binding subunit